jgi:malonyl-CoA O-methyltransferase
VAPPDAALAEMRRVLKPGGLLLASSFGPETLRELRAAWEAGDAGVHVNEFVDVHDLGSALARAGFVEPVLDVDRVVHHYADTRALMRELKALGAHNLDVRRARGLTGRRTFERMNASYESMRQPAGLPATWQLVYAVGWSPADGVDQFPLADETRIGVAALRASLARRSAVRR